MKIRMSPESVVRHSQAVVFGLLGGVLVWLCGTDSDTYGEVRGPLFTASVTAASFIVTLSAFAFTHGMPTYEARIKQYEQDNPDEASRDSDYAARLAGRLIDNLAIHRVTVGALLSSAFVQMTLGLYDASLCIVICAGVAFWSAAALVVSLTSLSLMVSSAFHSKFEASAVAPAPAAPTTTERTEPSEPNASTAAPSEQSEARA